MNGSLGFQSRSYPRVFHQCMVFISSFKCHLQITERCNSANVISLKTVTPLSTSLVIHLKVTSTMPTSAWWVHSLWYYIVDDPFLNHIGERDTTGIFCLYSGHWSVDHRDVSWRSSRFLSDFQSSPVCYRQQMSWCDFYMKVKMRKREKMYKSDDSISIVKFFNQTASYTFFYKR